MKTQPLAHKNDPITSFEAAESAQGVREYHHNIIYHTLLRYGDMTGPEIAANCTLDRYQVQRRMKEMVARNTVFDTGKKRVLISGKRAIIWGAR